MGISSPAAGITLQLFAINSYKSRALETPNPKRDDFINQEGKPYGIAGCTVHHDQS